MDTSEQSPYISYKIEDNNFVYGIVITFIIIIILLIIYVTKSKSSFIGRKLEISAQY
jgi:hypothetical protein